MELLNKKDILEKQDFDYKDIEVPEWGGQVRVKAMSGEERDKFESSIVSIKNYGTKNQSQELNQDNIRARLCAYCIVDEDFNRLFDDKDIIKLGKKSSKALDRVFSVAQNLSGITDKDVEELAKN